jgi:hypothetical protein
MSKRNPDIEATEPDMSLSGNSSKSDLYTTEHTENAANLGHQSQGGRQASVAAKLRNPLAGLTEQQVIADVDAWCVEKGLVEHQDAFRKGALIARMGQRDDGFEYVSQLSEEEKNILRNEQAHRWSQPFMLYFLVVQGMDQTAVNGAQVRFTSWLTFRNLHC